MNNQKNNCPIGVFDSGVGGLTVYRALRACLPHEDFVYLGDTARLPYGTKSPETVARYAAQIADHLICADIKLLVVACNTASALALPYLRQHRPDLPCLGVIEPGARAAAKATRTGQVVVLATEGTVRSGAYQSAIRRLLPQVQIQAIPCNLLVGLAEEGWSEGAEAEVVLRRYLADINLTAFDTVVLGCTHFPLLAPALRQLLPAGVSLVDSAFTTAEAVSGFLAEKGLQKSGSMAGQDRFQVTDGPERFRLMAQRFLGDQAVEGVEVVTL